MLQRFGYPIESSSVCRLFILLCRNYSVRDQHSLLIDSLKSKFDIRQITIKENPKFRVLVRDSVFHGMPLDLQHKLIMEMLPEDIRDEVVVETFDIPQEDADREVSCFANFDNLYIELFLDCNIPATPQSLLDTAVYHLEKQSGSMASESLWLCASLALKNFCISNGFDPKKHTSKNRVVEFLKKSYKPFRSHLDSSWTRLNYCHQNVYEDDLSLDSIMEYLESTELFCNTLFKIHDSKQFSGDKFKMALPKSMKEVGNMYFDFN
uniref:RNA-directed RNA polymerase n=1 Tax=Heterorhabditis bacteriophora TaxID=37862 RepID=A0A1I7XKV5_HETBA